MWREYQLTWATCIQTAAQFIQSLFRQKELFNFQLLSTTKFHYDLTGRHFPVSKDTVVPCLDIKL